MLGKDTSTESSHDTKVIVTYMALYKVVPVGISSYEEHRRHSTLKKTLEHAARQEEVIRSTQDAFKVIHCPAQADSSFVGDQILCNTDGFVPKVGIRQKEPKILLGKPNYTDRMASLKRYGRIDCEVIRINWKSPGGCKTFVRKEAYQRRPKAALALNVGTLGCSWIL